MNRDAIGLVIALEGQRRHAERENRRSFCPALIGLHEAREQARELRLVRPRRHDVAPRLFVERGRGPARSLEEGAEIGFRYVAVRKPVGAPTFCDEILDRVLGFGVLDHAFFLPGPESAWIRRVKKSSLADRRRTVTPKPYIAHRHRINAASRAGDPTETLVRIGVRRVGWSGVKRRSDHGNRRTLQPVRGDARASLPR